MSKKIDIQDLLDGYEYEDAEMKINWKSIFSKINAKRKLFLITLPIAFVLAYVFASGMPKYYVVKVKLAPEFSSMTSSVSPSGSLGSIMRSFGIGTASSNSGDAILPTLYPDLMNSTAFLVSLFDIPVQTKDGTVKTAYYDYLANNQKKAWWAEAKGTVAGWFSSDAATNMDDYKGANAGALTKRQAAIASAIESRIKCDVDDKTGVISIVVKDQDPVICAAIADSTCNRLQEFITEYRTKKARIEMNNAQVQCDKAQAEYEEAKREVEAFTDGNWDLVDEDFKVEQKSLENEMQLKFSTYSALNAQLITARSKYEGLRPVYTILDGASVPLVPAGPQKMKYILGILLLVLVIDLIWVFKGEIKMYSSSQSKDVA